MRELSCVASFWHNFLLNRPINDAVAPWPSNADMKQTAFRSGLLKFNELRRACFLEIDISENVTNPNGAIVEKKPENDRKMSFC